MSKVILEGSGLSMAFGGLHAVHLLSFKLHKGELMGLIGPNGAGKTTVFNMLSGLYAPSQGEIVLDGEIINGTPPHILARKGIARTFQNIRLFDYLSCLDNVKVSMNKDMKYNVMSGMFRGKAYWEEEKDSAEKALEILKILGMEDMANVRAGSLPYGSQRKLEIARAMGTNPKVLLLDEPAAGMNPSETEELMDTIRLIKEKFSVSVLLIEHDMNLVLGICQHLIVLNQGQKIAEGDPKEVINNPEVVTAYLGKSEKEDL